MSYSTQAGAVAFLPSGGLPNPARVAYGSAAGDYIESDGHGLVSGAEVILRAETGGSVPTGLTAGTTYFAIVISAARLQLAATSGGPAIALSSDGLNFVYTSPLPWAAWCEWADRQVDSFLPPSMIPLVDPPELAITAANELAAMRGLQATGGATIDLGARIDSVGQRITRWAKGAPVRGVALQVTQPSFLAITASAGATDPRGWAGSDNTRIP